VAARRTIAFVYGVHLGQGGLGVQAGNALRDLAGTAAQVDAIGPGFTDGWQPPPNVVFHETPGSWTPLFHWTPLRRRAGLTTHVADWRIGRFAARRLDRLKPDLCYAFTQVALEPLEWARARGVPSILESPNGHIRSFRQVYVDEARRWCDAAYQGHPTDAMVERVEREYELATHIRVSSNWARQSLVAGGVPQTRIRVLQQPVDLERFRAASVAPADSTLRVCFVGSLDLRKGFVYLLRAARAAASPISLMLVGATGDRCSRAILDRERHGLEVEVAPGDPRPALARSDLFVLPTLEDGSPFAAAEAMASGRAVVTTTATGAAEWISAERTGWVVEPGSEQSLASALQRAHERRADLPAMGHQARLDTEARVAACRGTVAAWLETV
jgi:glycosyltransferase involved in cell wall biosynthesis